ncbi:Rossmann-fold NAD(P)-binding domain-containing protein [Spongiactinospora rosea]|uniref:hypothetical protein n=1 Tax=Spongiactinospora rosea TaxID=2248750 RepID=UPI0018F4EF51|nr:hypothetical protein [Spongiactinospora rosea]
MCTARSRRQENVNIRRCRIGRRVCAALLLQGKEAAAWPAVRAVLDPDVRGGELYGPRVFGFRGRPVREPVRGHLADTALAARVWDLTADLTGLDPMPGLTRR